MALPKDSKIDNLVNKARDSAVKRGQMAVEEERLLGEAERIFNALPAVVLADELHDKEHNSGSARGCRWYEETYTQRDSYNHKETKRRFDIVWESHEHQIFLNQAVGILKVQPDLEKAIQAVWS